MWLCEWNTETVMEHLKASYALHTSPKASVPPKMSPQARAISPRNTVTPSSVMSTSLTPRYEWILDLL
jgi:hypothetical protein